VNDVIYDVSLDEKMYHGHNGDETVTLYLPSIWRDTQDEDWFVDHLVYVSLIERVCLEMDRQGLHGKRRKCLPCKPGPVAAKMLMMLYEY